MLNIKKLFAEFFCKKSRAQAKSMGAVKLWADHLSVAVLFQGCKWYKMSIALSFLHRPLEWPVLQHKDCDLAFCVVCLFGEGKSFCTQNLPTKAGIAYVRGSIYHLKNGVSAAALRITLETAISCQWVLS